MKRRKSVFIAAFLGVLAALAASVAIAAMYKWVDENGRVVYGDTPPAGVKAERMNTGVAPADPSAVRDMANKDAEIKKRMQQRVDDEAKVDKDRADQNLRRSQCQQAVVRVKALREDPNVYRYNEKGERVSLDNVAREEMIAQNHKIMRDLGCTPAIQP
jgi:Domain of unknown function (DUF4124)